MTATILLIRHAAHGDLDRRLSGRREGVALSEAGERQLGLLRSRLAGVAIDRVEASPLERTVATARAVAEAAGLGEPQPVDALLELDLGDWTGRTLDSLHGDPEWDRWNRQRGTARVPGGESMAEAQARIVGHLQRTAAAWPGRTVAMISHSDMIRAAVAHVLGLPLDNLLRFDIDPASVTRIVVGDWGAKLLRLNEGVE